MNKENIQKVIDAIAFNEHSHFNMSTYIGSLNYHNHDDVYSRNVPALNIRDEDLGKDIFNCSTTACIAGFASAFLLPVKKLDNCVTEPSSKLKLNKLLLLPKIILASSPLKYGFDSRSIVLVNCLIFKVLV